MKGFKVCVFFGLARGPFLGWPNFLAAMMLRSGIEIWPILITSTGVARGTLLRIRKPR